MYGKSTKNLLKNTFWQKKQKTHRTCSKYLLLKVISIKLLPNNIHWWSNFDNPKISWHNEILAAPVCWMCDNCRDQCYMWYQPKKEVFSQSPFTNTFLINKAMLPFISHYKMWINTTKYFINQVLVHSTMCTEVALHFRKGWKSAPIYQIQPVCTPRLIFLAPPGQVLPWWALLAQEHNKLAS